MTIPEVYFLPYCNRIFIDPQTEYTIPILKIHGFNLIYGDGDRHNVGLDMQTIPSTGSDEDSDGSSRLRHLFFSGGVAE